jgi:hypothetical protein
MTNLNAGQISICKKALKRIPFDNEVYHIEYSSVDEYHMDRTIWGLEEWIKSNEKNGLSKRLLNDTLKKLLM